ncbi:hypothetical protein K492DRAFT_187885 [Lichtheimia hyalospora FSU 10163]|nr:hypothetical protein K492DRAFT_187885 [Lichtheimia hyalospora FSU 10163]
MCPAFQQSDLDSFQALFPDVSILSGLGHDADFNLLYGSHSSNTPATRSMHDRYKDTTTYYGESTSSAAMNGASSSDDGLTATTMPDTISLHEQPSSGPSTFRHDTSSSSSSSGGSDKGGPLFSYREWHQLHLPKENERRPIKRKPGGKPGLVNGGRQMIDSVDGVFADDFGSMFEAHQGHPPANVYNENEYIEPSGSPTVSNTGTNGNSGGGNRNNNRFADIPVQSLKERFNYASIDCAATVRGANKEAKGAQSILYESKDQYMLNKCSANKYVIINLCEEILIDTIVLANFEFFSSTFKDFRVYVADRYPTNDWKLLGQWQARNTRDLQVFKVTNRIGWFDNIKIEFLTHYGHEYYCPLSLVRVHGMYMWEYYNLIESRGLAGDTDEDALIEKYLWPSEVRDEIIHPRIDVGNDTAPMPESKEEDKKQVPIIPPIPDDQIYIVPEPPQREITGAASVIMEGANTMTTTTSTSVPTIPSFTEISMSSNSITAIPHEPSIIVDEAGASAVMNEPMERDESKDIDGLAMEDYQDNGYMCMILPRTLKESTQRHDQPTATIHASTTSFVGPLPSNQIEETATAAISRIIPVPKMPHKDGNSQSESIYKTIMKRLNALELNATLSQRYLDEQNRMLNDVLRNMEQRHQDQLIMLLGRLNDTASSRIESMRYRYEQLYDELRYQSERTTKEMTVKMALLADQIAFERRVSMAQLAVVITLFVFVALSRGTLSILSPIMEAQAQERKRRESADHPTTTTSTITTTTTTTTPIAPKPSSPTTTPPLPEKKENTALNNEIPVISSPSVDEEEEEHRRIRHMATITAAEDHHRRSLSEGGDSAPLMRSWSDMGVSSAESFSPTTEESRDEISELLQRQRKPSNDDAVVPQRDLDTR